MTTPCPVSPAVRYWLYACLALVLLMVFAGGLTRLTESGLSIVEWKVVTGTLPPLSDASWQQEFAAYRASPQYQKINAGMTLADFKRIFWLEYNHRLLGRLAGLVFFMPYLWFLARRQLPRRLGWRMAFLILLVGLQGVAGWHMVKSGLIDDPRVSPSRLALHLGLAIAIFSGLVVTLARSGEWRVTSGEKNRESGIGNREPTILPDHRPPTTDHLSHHSPLATRRFLLSLAVTALLILQMLLGALVAGLDAGLTYNTFPLMDGRFIPTGIASGIFWENIAAVQFAHRWTAFILLGLLIMQHHRLKPYTRLPSLRFVKTGIIFAAFLQVALGIATLLYVVPVPLAAAHQMTAFLLLYFCLRLNYLLYCETICHKNAQ